MLCAGLISRREGGAGTCEGDSGGPLLCSSDGHTWAVNGVVSWGPAICLSKPGVFADVATMRPWINSVARSNGSLVKNFQMLTIDFKLFPTLRIRPALFKGLLCRIVYQAQISNWVVQRHKTWTDEELRAIAVWAKIGSWSGDWRWGADRCEQGSVATYRSSNVCSTVAQVDSLASPSTTWHRSEDVHFWPRESVPCLPNVLFTLLPDSLSTSVSNAIDWILNFSATW